MATLYQKYRPQTWETVEAQEHVKKTLMQELIENVPAHALLFTGPRGVGKTTTARLFARALNCKQREENTAEPCNECESCQEITRGQGMDVIEIDAASHTGVDNVREHIIENARFAPTKSVYKVFIIDEVHMLSNSAFNALLKTLEEPPRHVIFIMATTETHKVPATIISRCQRFDFRHINQETMMKRLQKLAEQEGRVVDEAVLRHIAWKSGGSMRDSESLLGQLLAATSGTVTSDVASQILPQRQSEDTIAYIAAALHGNIAEGFALVKRIVEGGASIPHFFDDAIDTARALLLLKTTSNLGDTYFTAQDVATLTELAQNHEITDMTKLLDALLTRRLTVGSSPILHLPLELLLATLHNEPVTKVSEKKKVVEKIEKPVAPKVEIVAQPTTPPPTPEITVTLPEENITPTETVAPITTTATETQTESPVITATATAVETALTFEEVESKWNAFVDHTPTYNHSLPFVLKTGKPKKIEGTTLTISLPYAFHAKRLEEFKVQEVINKATKDIYGVSLTIIGDVDESQSVAHQDEAVNKVLETFGGTVVG